MGKNKIPKIIENFSRDRIPQQPNSVIKEYKDVSLLTLVEKMEDNLSHFESEQKKLFEKKLSELNKRIQKYQNGPATKALLQQEQNIEQAILAVEAMDPYNLGHNLNWFNYVISALNSTEESSADNAIEAFGENRDAFKLNGYIYRLEEGKLKKNEASKDEEVEEVNPPSKIKEALLSALKDKLTQTQNDIRSSYSNLEKDKKVLFDVIEQSYSLNYQGLADVDLLKEQFNKDCEKLQQTLALLKPKPSVKKELPTSLSLVFSPDEIKTTDLHDLRANLLNEIQDTLTAQELEIGQFYDILIEGGHQKYANDLLKLYNNEIKKQLLKIKQQIEEFRAGGDKPIEVSAYLAVYKKFKNLQSKISPKIEKESNDISKEKVEDKKEEKEADKLQTPKVADDISKQTIELMMDEKNRKIDELQAQVKDVNKQLNNAINNKNELLKMNENQLNKVKEDKDNEIKTLQEQVNQLKNEQKQQDTTGKITLASGGIGTASATGAVIGTAAGSSIAGLIFAALALVCLIVCVVSLIANSKSIGSEGVNSQTKSINHHMIVGDKISLQEKNKQVMNSKNKEKYLNNTNEQKNDITTTLKDKNNQIETNKTKSL